MDLEAAARNVTAPDLLEASFSDMMAKMTDYRMKVKRDSDRLRADLSRRLGFIENITGSAACTLNQKQLLFQRMWKESRALDSQHLQLFHNLHEDEIETLVSAVIQLEHRQISGMTLCLQTVDDIVFTLHGQVKLLQDKLLALEGSCVLAQEQSTSAHATQAAAQIEINAMRRDLREVKELTLRHSLKLLSKGKDACHCSATVANSAQISPQLREDNAGMCRSTSLPPNSMHNRREVSEERLQSCLREATQAEASYRSSSRGRERSKALARVHVTQFTMIQEAQMLSALQKQMAETRA